MTESRTESRGSSHTVRRALAFAGLLGVAGLAGVTGLTLTARRFWLGEVASNFGWQIGWAGLAGVLLLLALCHRRLALIAVVLSLWHLWPELSLLAGRDEASGQRPELTAASVNLLWGNQDDRAFIEWLERERPDVVALHEVSRDWIEVLRNQRETYPYLLLGPEEAAWTGGTWGAALLSKLPPREARLLLSDIPGPPVLEIVLHHGGREVTIRSAHTMRPGGGRENEHRDRVLAALGGLEWGATDILIGDLNVTSSSPVFTDLLAGTGLKDTRRGFGRLPTWRKTLPVGSLWFAIDHILIGPELLTLDRRTAPLPGSDHLIAIARLAFP